jgi:hypothetical protein
VVGVILICTSLQGRHPVPEVNVGSVHLIDGALCLGQPSLDTYDPSLVCWLAWITLLTRLTLGTLRSFRTLWTIQTYWTNISSIALLTSSPIGSRCPVYTIYSRCPIDTVGAISTTLSGIAFVTLLALVSRVAFRPHGSYGKDFLEG